MGRTAGATNLQLARTGLLALAMLYSKSDMATLRHCSTRVAECKRASLRRRRSRIRAIPTLANWRRGLSFAAAQWCCTRYRIEVEGKKSHESSIWPGTRTAGLECRKEVCPRSVATRRARAD